MRDFKNDGHINISGDFTVTDNSHNEHKLLIHCSSEELLQERPFRQENIRLEQARKVKRLKPFYVLSLLLFAAAAGWAAVIGKTDLMSLFMGLGSLFFAFHSLRATFEPNAFQQEEHAAVREISKLLRQRRVE